MDRRRVRWEAQHRQLRKIQRGVGSDRLGGPSPSDNQYDWEFDYPGGGANVNVSRHWCQRQQRRFRWTCHQQVRDYPVCEAVASCTDNDAHGLGTRVAGSVARVRCGVVKHATTHGLQEDP